MDVPQLTVGAAPITEREFCSARQLHELVRPHLSAELSIRDYWRLTALHLKQ